MSLLKDNTVMKTPTMASACLVFGVVTDIVTGIWVYIGRNLPFHTLAYAMFFPTILSFCFVTDYVHYFWRIVGTVQVSSTIYYAVLAIPLSLLMVLLCVGLDLLLGWGSRTAFKEGSLHQHNSSYLSGFLRASGEEVGWRCYMLPCLMSQYSPFMAITISGIIWGLFHVPVLILLTKRHCPPKPHITVFVQCLSCVLSAFPHAWIAIKSRYSFWASAMLHATWNRMNPLFLGSIYTQSPGYIEGEQWLINGEGLAGCFVMLPIAGFVVWDLS